MSDLQHYLAQHYLNDEQLAAAAALPVTELDQLIAGQLVPAPSYVVGDAGTVRSFVFGEMAAPGAAPGRYFPPSQLVWIALAQAAIADGGAPKAAARLREQFVLKFATALASLNLSLWRLHDSFDDQGTPIADGLQVRTDNAWKYFLNGTFGLCVANPVSEAHIAYKEVLQEKLTEQSANGSRTDFTPTQAQEMRALVDAYAVASMPFSPAEYALSSRKRLVEDLRARIDAAQAREAVGA